MRDRTNNRTHQATEKSDSQNKYICIALGFFLSLLGVLLASITNKTSGLKYAFGGIALRWLLCVSLFVFLSGLGSATRDLQVQPDDESVQTQTTDEGQSEKTTTPPSSASAWHYMSKQSPIDDSTTHILMCVSAEKVGRFNKSPARLMIRHKEGQREVLISWPSYIRSRSIPVTIRFDKDDAVTENWGISTDGTAVFSPFPFADFWGMVKDSRLLVVRLTPYGESPATVTFDLSNIPPAALTAFN